MAYTYLLVTYSSISYLCFYLDKVCLTFVQDLVSFAICIGFGPKNRVKYDSQTTGKHSNVPD